MTGLDHYYLGFVNPKTVPCLRKSIRKFSKHVPRSDTTKPYHIEREDKISYKKVLKYLRELNLSADHILNRKKWETREDLKQWITKVSDLEINGNKLIPGDFLVRPGVRKVCWLYHAGLYIGNRKVIEMHNYNLNNPYTAQMHLRVIDIGDFIQESNGGQTNIVKTIKWRKGYYTDTRQYNREVNMYTTAQAMIYNFKYGLSSNCEMQLNLIVFGLPYSSQYKLYYSVVMRMIKDIARKLNRWGIHSGLDNLMNL